MSEGLQVELGELRAASLIDPWWLFGSIHVKLGSTQIGLLFTACEVVFDPLCLFSDFELVMKIHKHA